MSKELFHAILDKKFYTDFKDLLEDDLFVGEIKNLYSVVKWAYEKGSESLTTEEVKVLYNERNPTETLSKKALVHKLLDDLSKDNKLQPAVAILALKQARINLKKDEAATLLIQDDVNFGKVKEILTEIDKINDGKEDSDIIDMDIDYLLSRTKQNCKWKFNIPSLVEYVTGIGESTFTVIAGRVNSGKSLSAISFCFGPNGFAAQGARVLYVCNEEDGAFTGLRAISSYTGLTIEEITNNKLSAAKEFADIRQNVIAVDNAKISMHSLIKMVEKHKPDIVVVDMLDHLQINGDFAREDQRLGQIYRQAREVAKLHRCAFIGVSQTSAESDGKLHYGFDALAGSKTDKPAACDLILLLGAEAPNDRGEYSDVRAINIAKNKITGRHGAVSVIIQPFKSRLVA